MEGQADPQYPAGDAGHLHHAAVARRARPSRAPRPFSTSRKTAPFTTRSAGGTASWARCSTSSASCAAAWKTTSASNSEWPRELARNGHGADSDPGPRLRPDRGRGQLAGLDPDGHRVVFATESGTPGVADDIMVTGRGLDIWSALPVLDAIPLLGLMLRANKDGRSAYADMVRSAEFQHPVTWAQATLDDVDALLLPGGHRARGMRSYIDSDILQRLVVDAFARGVIGGRDLSRCAACRAQRRSRHRSLGALRAQDHGVDLGDGAPGLAAHADHPILGSAITTGPIPRSPANPAATCRCSRKSLARLRDPTDFCDVVRGSSHWRLKSSGMVRDTATDSRPAFVVDDGNYVSARWPGDTAHLRRRFVAEAQVTTYAVQLRPPDARRRTRRPGSRRPRWRPRSYPKPAMRSSGWPGRLFAKLCPTPG